MDATTEKPAKRTRVARKPCEECTRTRGHADFCTKSSTRPDLTAVPVDQLVAELRRRKDEAAATLQTIADALAREG